MVEVGLFVSLIYGRFWHEALLASNAPFNDAKMLELLQIFPNHIVADAAFRTTQLVGLSFFDSRLDTKVKRAMVANLQLPKSPSAVKRVERSGADFTRLEICYDMFLYDI